MGLNWGTGVWKELCMPQGDSFFMTVRQNYITRVDISTQGLTPNPLMLWSRELVKMSLSFCLS